MPIISEIKGDIVELGKEGRYEAIVHGCNCFHTFGAGLAPQIKKAWPEAFKADLHTIKGDKAKLGNFSTYYDEGRDLYVFNLYTQYGFDRVAGQPDVDYLAVANAFTRLNKLVPSLTCNSPQTENNIVGIPMIGAGLAGGHWQAISTIIDLATPDLSLELVVYNP